MAVRKQTFSFSGGLNVKVSDFLLKDDELRIALNVHYDSIGALTRRNGFTPLGTKPNSDSVKFLLQYGRSDGYRRFMRFAGQYIHAWDTSSYTQIKSGLNTSAKPQAVNFLDNMIYTNGTDTPESYDGRDFSTSRNVASMPKGKYIRVFKFRVYVAGVDTEPNKVFYSSLPSGFVANPSAAFTLGQTATGGALSDGTYYVAYAFRSDNGETKLQTEQSIVLNGGTSTQVINVTALPALPTGATSIAIYIGTVSGTLYFQGTTTSTTYNQTTSLLTALSKPLVNTTYGVSWTTGNGSIDVATGEDGLLTGLDVTNDRLVIYCEFATYRWDNYKLVRADTSFGAASALCLARIVRFSFHANRDGIFVYDGVDDRIISAKVEDYIRGINQANIGDINGAAFQRKFYLAVGDTAEYKRAIAVTKAVFVYDYDQNNWTIYDNHDAKCWSTFITSGVENLYFGTSDGYIMKALTGNDDNGAVINYRAKIGKKFLGSPEELKNFDKVYSFQENGAGAALFLYVEGRSPVTIASLQEEMVQIDVIDSGRYYELEVAGSDKGEPFVWNGYNGVLTEEAL